MSLEALYPRPLLRLAADAHGAGRLPRPDVTVTRTTPLCGDRITLELTLSEARVLALAHDVKACVICQASASRLAQIAAGRDLTSAQTLRAAVAAMLAGGASVPDYSEFASVAAQRSRHTCVLLPLDALIEALSGD